MTAPERTLLLHRLREMARVHDDADQTEFCDADPAVNVAAAAVLEPWLDVVLCPDLLREAAALIARTPDPTPGTRAEGLEEAARWHDGRAAALEPNATYWPDGTPSNGVAFAVRCHRDDAAAIRTFAPPTSPKPAREAELRAYGEAVREACAAWHEAEATRLRTLAANKATTWTAEIYFNGLADKHAVFAPGVRSVPLPPTPLPTPPTKED